MSHYVIIIIVIIGIIYLQFYFFVKNRQKQKELKSIFPINSDSELTTTDSDGISIIATSYLTTELLSTERVNEVEEIEIRDSEEIRELHEAKKNQDYSVRVKGDSAYSSVFQNITSSINNYLIENKGAASDFHLIKDVVDRNCDNVEEEIATLTPIPLYLGLIGTMIGILVGVGFLVFSGGLDALFSTTQDNSASAGIDALLGGVALAMSSSIFGILLTTTGSYYTKEAKNELNKNKNGFLSWIQVKLLPTLSGNATSAIYTLQQNLSNFNSTFASNIKDMGAAFSAMNHSHQDQLKLMQLVDKMDVTKMAKANVEVLQELQKNTHEFDRFNQYIHSVTDYLGKVEKLSTVINEHLNRTKAIEDMGIFFKDEIKQIEERKGTISRTVGEVDVTLQNALRKIQENAEQQLNEFIKLSVTQHQKFNKAIEEQQESLQQRLQETTQLIVELNNLTAVKTSMSNLEKSTSEQNKKISDLTSAIEKLAAMKVEGTPNLNRINTMPQIPKWLKVSIITVLSIVGVAGLLYIIPQIIFYMDLFISSF